MQPEMTQLFANIVNSLLKTHYELHHLEKSTISHNKFYHIIKTCHEYTDNHYHFVNFSYNFYYKGIIAAAR